MRAELAVAREMVAFGEEIGVQFTENRRKAIDVVELLFDRTSRYPQAIAEGLLAIGNVGDEETVRMDPYAFGGDFARRRIDDGHFLRRRQHRADANSTGSRMHAEEGERVAMPGLDDRLALRVRPPGHAPPPPSWPRYRGHPSVGCRPSPADWPVRKKPRRPPFQA